MNRVELAWAAGLFEGEGSFSAYPREGRLGPRGYPYAELSSTDEDTLIRFRDAVKLGTVTGPHIRKDKPNSKPQWRWRLQGLEGTQALISLLWYGLGLRRRARARGVINLAVGADSASPPMLSSAAKH